MALIACGRVGRPHGIRGELRFWPLNPSTTLLAPGRSIQLGHRPDACRTFVIEECRQDAKGYSVRLAGLADREKAAELTGSTWYEPRAAFPEPEDDEVYVADLIGLPVRTEAGEAIGTIADVWQAGAADVLVIRGPSGEHLVPNVDAFVIRLDPAVGEVVIRPIEGLLSQPDEPEGADKAGDGPGA